MKYLILAFTLLVFVPGYSQKPDVDDKKPEKLGISGQYKKVKLGMNRGEVLKILQGDVDLELDVETDYGDFDKEQKYVVKAKRHPFIDYIYYQFISKNDLKDKTETHKEVRIDADTGKSDEDWILYAIIIKFNVKYNNYVSLYNKILSKYGEADERTSKYAIWKPEGRKAPKGSDNNIKVKLILNHPSTIKIIDDVKYQIKHVKDKKTPQEEVKNYQRELNEKLLKDFEPDTKEP